MSTGMFTPEQRQRLEGRVLTMVCRQRGLPAHFGRGFDELPAELLEDCRDSLVRAPDREELLRALGSTIKLLLTASGEVPELAARVGPELNRLVTPWA
ncbi:MAG TPA: hypothetical protein VF720_09455 [Candidatus Eisenbacteria bacterium]